MSILKLSDLYDAAGERPFISTDLGARTTLAYETFETDTRSKFGPATILVGSLPEPAADGHTHERIRINNRLGKLIVTAARGQGRDALVPGDLITFTVVDKQPFGDEGKEAPVWDVTYDPAGDPAEAELFTEGNPFG